VWGEGNRRSTEVEKERGKEEGGWGVRGGGGRERRREGGKLKREKRQGWERCQGVGGRGGWRR